MLQQNKQCHICKKKKFDYSEQHHFFAQCCKKKCNRLYCLNCIQDKFDDTFKPQWYRNDSWICYYCQQKCICQACLNIQNQKILQKQNKKIEKKKKIQTKAIQLKTKKDESSEQFVINIQDTNKVNHEVSKPQDTFLIDSSLILRNDISFAKNVKQNSEKPINIKLMKHSNQINQREQLIFHEKQIQQIKNRQQKYKKQSISEVKLPPYLKSIMLRKEIFKNFVQRVSGKNYQDLQKEAIYKINTATKNHQITNKQLINKQIINKQVIYKQVIKKQVVYKQVAKKQTIQTQSNKKIIDVQKLQFISESENSRLIHNQQSSMLQRLVKERLKQYEMSQQDSIQLL